MSKYCKECGGYMNSSKERKTGLHVGCDPKATQIQAIKDVLWAECKVAGQTLEKYPKLPNGLTPDDVKQSAEFKRDKQAYESAFARLRKFNSQNR